MRFYPGTPAYKAYHEMLDKVRAANTHLSPEELEWKLREARDEYVAKLRENDYQRAWWVLNHEK